MSSIDNQQCAHCEVDFYTAGRGEHYRQLCSVCDADRVERETAEQEREELHAQQAATVGQRESDLNM